jgi:hypothetical protein
VKVTYEGEVLEVATFRGDKRGPDMDAAFTDLGGDLP